MQTIERAERSIQAELRYRHTVLAICNFINFFKNFFRVNL